MLGDIIFTKGTGTVSDLNVELQKSLDMSVSLTDVEDHEYSHAGLMLGRYKVLHAIPGQGATTDLIQKLVADSINFRVLRNSKIMERVANNRPSSVDPFINMADLEAGAYAAVSQASYGRTMAARKKHSSQWNETYCSKLVVDVFNSSWGEDLGLNSSGVWPIALSQHLIKNGWIDVTVEYLRRLALDVFIVMNLRHDGNSPRLCEFNRKLAIDRFECNSHNVKMCDESLVEMTKFTRDLLDAAYQSVKSRIDHSDAAISAFVLGSDKKYRNLKGKLEKAKRELVASSTRTDSPTFSFFCDYFRALFYEFGFLRENPRHFPLFALARDNSEFAIYAELSDSFNLNEFETNLRYEFPQTRVRYNLRDFISEIVP
ncbi:hypothetical protein [Duganella vulcania]|uniref:Uncharacterized protein n=1 Tax=Duganella vulcania TaxID=2692166 RepID=A0A845GDX2_9BURK|nr:hypothetical protein [Duganella vulcania]MYM92823.1 hypothetical protein [Duganella vulcania]